MPHARWLAASLLCVAAAPAIAGDKPRIVDEGGIRDRWMFAEGVSPRGVGYPADFVPLALDVCIALGYRIEADGRTSRFVLLDQWNSRTGKDEPVPGFWAAFSGAAAEAVSQWRFQPRPGTGDAGMTFTVATVGFVGGGGVGLDVVRGKCKIADLPAHLAAMGDEQRERLELERLDHAYRQRERITNEWLTRPASSANPYSR